MELEEFAASRSAEHKVRPAFKGYRGYPACCARRSIRKWCTGFPASRSLKEGDIISLDFGSGVQRLLRRCSGDGSGRRRSRPERRKLLRSLGNRWTAPSKKSGRQPLGQDVSAAVQQWVEERTGIRSFAICAATGLALEYARGAQRAELRRSRDTGLRSKKEWFSRLSRWSTWADPR